MLGVVCFKIYTGFRLGMFRSTSMIPHYPRVSQPSTPRKYGRTLDLYVVWAWAVRSNAGTLGEMRGCEAEIKRGNSGLPGARKTGLEAHR